MFDKFYGKYIVSSLKLFFIICLIRGSFILFREKQLVEFTQTFTAWCAAMKQRTIWTILLIRSLLWKRKIFLRTWSTFLSSDYLIMYFWARSLRYRSIFSALPFLISFYLSLLNKDMLTMWELAQNFPLDFLFIIFIFY